MGLLNIFHNLIFWSFNRLEYVFSTTPPTTQFFQGGVDSSCLTIPFQLPRGVAETITISANLRSVHRLLNRRKLQRIADNVCTVVINLLTIGPRHRRPAKALLMLKFHVVESVAIGIRQTKKECDSFSGSRISSIFSPTFFLPRAIRPMYFNWLKSSIKCEI